MSYMFSARFAAVLIGASLIMSQSAFAKPATAFMLQFGSFESTKEANDRVSSLKAKHGGLIGRLPSRVLEISLPDNLTVFRTQSGPVASRAEAQSICAQLASNGDECYVVETAMIAQDAPMLANAAPAVSAPEAPKLVAKPLETAKAATPIVTEKAMTAVAPSVTNVEPKVDVDMPTVRALTSAPAISNISSQPEAKLSSEARIDKELAQIEKPEFSKNSAVAPAVKTASTERGFWSRLNPFSNDASVDVPTTSVMAPSAKAVELPSIKAKSDIEMQKTVEDVNKAGNAIILPKVPVSQPVASVESSLRLPPPPPLTDKSKMIFESNKKDMPIVTAAPLDSDPGLQVGAVSEPSANTPFAKASTETLSRVGKTTAIGSGVVKVGEAQRVPLTQTTNAVSVAPADASIRLTAAAIAVPQANIAAPEVMAMPSQDTAKTLWAELGRFSDASKALAFWDAFRNKNPDFPVVRVRVTQTYAEKTRGDSAVNLRVGPFAKEASIAYLCRTMKENDVSCSTITDLGASSSSTQIRARAEQGEEAFATSAASQPFSGQYWLQLGSYPTLVQAQNTWADLKQRYSAALTGASPNISVPALSSAARPVYRLRSGPFATEMTANAACARLKSAGGNCVVSSQ